MVCACEVYSCSRASFCCSTSSVSYTHLIPWNGPIAGISVGLVDGEIVLNPTLEQRQHNDLHLTVAGTKDKIVMIEAGANEVPEDTMLQAILTGHEEIKKMVAFISEIQAKIGKEKFTFEAHEVDQEPVSYTHLPWAFWKLWAC